MVLFEGQEIPVAPALYQRSVLENGLRIITTEMPTTRSVSICIYVGVGSRHESPELSGAAHFIEHMLFKGSERYPTPQSIAQAIEGVGGFINAGTDKETTSLYAKVASPHFTRALDVLIDILRTPKFDPEDVEKERKVISEEIKTTTDTPAEWVDFLFDELMWGQHSLGRDIAGTIESVNALTLDQLKTFMHRHYSPRNIVIAVAGNVTHNQVLEEIEKRLGDWQGEAGLSFEPAPKLELVKPRLLVRYKKTEQTNLCLGVPAASYEDPQRFPLRLLNVLLGEGMSARLFIEVRERLALAYDVHSYTAQYKDAGMSVVYAAVDNKRPEQAIEAILREMDKLKQPVPEEELARAKEFVKGGTLLRMEDTFSNASWFGSRELLNNDVMTVDEVIAQIEQVTTEEVAQLAQDLFRPERLHLAVVGPYRSESRFAKVLGSNGKQKAMA